MAEPNIPADIRKMSFEQALEELKEIVERLEQGQGELDQAIEAYQRGALLKQHCEAKLRDAEQKIAKISLGADGSVGSEDLDLE
jgi:exodeoxyribonuclease VII small subunit